MSDLTATNCGCNDSCGCAGAQNNNGCNSCIWIILLLFFCGGNNGCGNNGCGNNGCGILGGGNNGCCDWIIWILLLSCFCGNGNGSGCGCGCN